MPQRHPDYRGVLFPQIGVFDAVPRVEFGDVDPSTELGASTVEIRMTVGDSQEELLGFLLEEAFEHQVSRVAIDPSNRLHQDIAKLSSKKRKRWLIDIKEDHTNMPELQALMRPIAEEFHVNLYPDGLLSKTCLEDQLKNDLILVYSGMYRFLLGIKHGLRIDIPLQDFRDALRRLRRK